MIVTEFETMRNDINTLTRLWRLKFYNKNNKNHV